MKKMFPGPGQFTPYRPRSEKRRLDELARHLGVDPSDEIQNAKAREYKIRLDYEAKMAGKDPLEYVSQVTAEHMELAKERLALSDQLVQLDQQRDELLARFDEINKKLHPVEPIIRALKSGNA